MTYKKAGLLTAEQYFIFTKIKEYLFFQHIFINDHLRCL